ncbi:hypothetical protein D3C73_871590 [compost metagenome]
MVGIAQQVRALRFVEHHEGEFAAQPQHAAQQQRLPRTELGDAADGVQQAELHHQQDRHTRGDHPRFGGDAVQVDAHAHGDEEQAQQQTLERLDLRFQLVPEFRIGQQHAGQERPQAGAQAGFLHEPGGAQHHQQRGGGEHFRAAGARDDAEQAAQHRPPAQDHHCQRAQRDGRIFPAQRLVLDPAQQRNRGQQRNGDQVLEQQDGKPQPAVVAVDRLVLGQQLQADRGRRQRQRHAHHQRTLPLEVIEQQQAAQHQPGQRHLRRARTEHRAPHHLQPGRGQLQPDHEQQHDHADLGGAEDAVGVLYEAEAIRPQHHAGRQVAQHRAEAELLEHRHRDHRGQQQDQRQFQTTAMHGNTWSSGGRLCVRSAGGSAADATWPLCARGCVRTRTAAGPLPGHRPRVDLHRPPVQTARRCRHVRQYTPPESPTHVQRQ